MSSEHTRRGFFQKAFRYGFPIALGAGGTWLADKFGGALIQRVVDISIPEPKELTGGVVGSAKSLLFGSGADYKVIPALNNPYKILGFEAPISSATADAAAHLNKLLHVPNVRVITTNRLTAHETTGNLLVLGSPVANPIAAEIMGRCGSSPLFDRGADRAALQFPFYLDIDASETIYNSGIYRSRGARATAPVWHLKGRGSALLVPTLSNGQPIEDRILITSVPNFLNKASLEANQRIVIFAGAHGVGTRALGLLIRNERVINELLSYAKHNAAWQAIVIVDQVSDDGRIPISLGGIEDLISFEADFDNLGKLSDPFARLQST